MIKDKTILKTIFFSRFILIILTILIFCVAISAGKAFWRKIQLDREVSHLKSAILEVERKNEELLNRLNYLKSEESLEKEARLQLNVRRPGEKVVVILEESPLASDFKENNLKNNSFQQKELNNSKGRSNFQKWWDYFFHQP